VDADSTVTTVPRGARLPRTARRAQLLGAAQEVFVANGYHATAMDEIAERAGVSKPVLYQHFPGKLELYRALLDQHTGGLVDAVRAALAGTDDNKQRVAASIEAYFAFVDAEGGAFRLVFESDLTSDDAVRATVERGTRECAEAIAEVIREDTGLPAADAEMLGAALVGLAQTTARYWLLAGGSMDRDHAARLAAQLAWRGLGGFPKAEHGEAAHAALG